MYRKPPLSTEQRDEVFPTSRIPTVGGWLTAAYLPTPPAVVSARCKLYEAMLFLFPLPITITQIISLISYHRAQPRPHLSTGLCLDRGDITTAIHVLFQYLRPDQAKLYGSLHSILLVTRSQYHFLLKDVWNSNAVTCNWPENIPRNACFSLLPMCGFLCFESIEPSDSRSD
jgi:hypothetical protein